MQYRSIPIVPALDGIRGIAILLVLLGHLHYLGFAWVGVQLFFVLSGFLITGILLQNRELPLMQYLRNFYTRRILRIFPLYYGYLIVCSIIAGASVLTHTTDFLGDFRHAWPYLYTYTFNYATHIPWSRLLDHLWSLSVEEQFYLAWPLIVYFWSRNAITRLLIAIVVCMPILRLGATFLMLGGQLGEWQPQVSNRNTLLIADSFAMGALLAFMPADFLRRRWGVAVAIGFAIVFGAGALNLDLLASQGQPASFLSFGYPNLKEGGFLNYQFAWGELLWNFAGSLMILSAMGAVDSTHPLNQPLLRYLGRISYGIYIFHYPLIAIRTHFYRGSPWTLSGVAWSFVVCVLSVCLAALSYNYYEQRFLRLKTRLN